MIHKTPNETTPNLYESDDGLVSVRILDDPHRNPPSSYEVAVFWFTPKAHTRILDLGDGLFEYNVPQMEAKTGRVRQPGMPAR